MKHGAIKALAGAHPVRKLCRVFGVARSAYYAAQRKAERPRAGDNARLGAKARELFEASGRTYGSPRLIRGVTPEGRALRTAAGGRAAASRRTARPAEASLPSPYHRQPPPLSHRAQPPGRACAAQVTRRGVAGRHHLRRHEGGLALCRGVLDACSRRIVGWAADDAMPTTLVARAFERAVQTQRPSTGLLHHSDRGSQYASDAYRELLRRHQVVPSMSRAANCYDNAKMESFWATLKGELIGDHVFGTRAEAKRAIFSCIEIFYNRTRLHGALGYTSPVDLENNPS